MTNRAEDVCWSGRKAGKSAAAKLRRRYAAHRNLANLLAFLVYNRNVSLRVHVDWTVRFNPPSHGFALGDRISIVQAIQPRRVDKPVAILDIEKVAGHQHLAVVYGPASWPPSLARSRRQIIRHGRQAALFKSSFHINWLREQRERRRRR